MLKVYAKMNSEEVLFRGCSSIVVVVCAVYLVITVWEESMGRGRVRGFEGVQSLFFLFFIVGFL